MMNYKTIYFLLIITILTSCVGKKKYDDMMQRADSIMDVDDDSAKVAIQMLDGAKSQLPDFTKGQRMRYELLYHKAMNKAYIPFTSDSVMLKVADYYEHHGSANDRMQAYYMLGCVYRDMHEAPMALEYYNKATEQADTIARNCDYATLFRIYGQMGILFDKQYLPYQELKAFCKAEKFAYLAKDTLNALRFYQNTTSAYDFWGIPDSSVAINTRVSQKLNSLGYKHDAAIAFGCNYDYFVKKKDWNNAKKSFDAYLSTGYEGNPNYKDAKAFLFCEQGTYYMYTNQLDSALLKLNQSYALSESYGNRSAVSKALAEYYRIINPSLAVKYALQSLEYNDSDLIEIRKNQLQQIQGLYDYSRHKELAILAEKKMIQRTHITYIVIIASFIIFLFITIYFRRNIILKKKRIAAAKVLYEDSLQKQKNLQEELAQLVKKNDENLRKVIQEKELALHQMKEEVRDIKTKFSYSLDSDADMLLKASSIYKKLCFVELHPKENICEDDWKELAKTVMRIIPSFIPLVEEKLSDKECRISMLVRLGFSTSFIARLVGISSSGVSVCRKRMYEKLLHKKGSPKDFDDFIRRMS